MDPTFFWSIGDFLPGVFIFVMVAAVLIGSIIWGLRRRKVWRAWVHGRNWRYIEHWPEMVREFSGGPFDVGSGRRAYYGFEGIFDGLRASGFQYQYTTGSGDDRTTHYYQVLRVRIPGARFPMLMLGRENFLTRAFGRDTQFENAEFNRRWRVTGSNARFVHDVVHPRMMEFLLGLDVEMENIWFERDSLLVSIPGRLGPEEVDGYLRLLTRSAAQIPPFVLKEVAAGRLEITWDGPGVSPEEQARRIAQFKEGPAKGVHGP